MKNLYFILAFVSLLFATNIIIAQDSLHYSAHKEQKDFYDNLGFTTDKQYDEYNGFKLMPKNKSVNASNCNLNKMVFGWFPYWQGSTYLNFEWDKLSDLSYFAYDVDPATGNATSTHNWSTAAVVDSALAHGVRVNLCATLFSSHSTFFGSSSAQQTLITNLISLVQNRNANGVNIDFEGVPSSYSADLSTFMQNLCTQMHNQIPGSQVSLCLYAVDWNNLFNFSALDPYVDYYTIMGYDYYYGGSSTAGPTGQLYTMVSFDYNLSNTVTSYINRGASRNKLILGLPYYGFRWQTDASTVPANTTSSGSAVTIKTLKDNASGNYSNPHFEYNSLSKYFPYNDGNWNQCWVDDEQTMKYKYQMVLEQDIAGIGIWALGYDDGYSSMWDLIEQYFTDCGSVACCDTIYDLGGPNHDYYNNENYTYTISPTGATALSLNFLSFDVEANYDTLWIYDGNSVSSPIIGSYTGTNSPGFINSSGNSLTIRFKSDNATTNPGWTAIWQCSVDNVLPTTIVNANNWETNDFISTYNDTDNIQVIDKFYQVLDNSDGITWEANNQKGFLNDNFETTISQPWVNTSGTWNISNNHLYQSDETSTNTNFNIDVKQDSNSVILYHWQMSIGGSGANRRAGLHFFCDSSDQTNRHNSYMAYFRVDQNKVQLYKYVNNVYTLLTNDNLNVNADTWYDYKIIFNTLTGNIKVFQNNILVSEYTDSNPFSVGNSISLRTGECTAYYDDVKIYKARTNNELISIGDSSSDVRYQNSSPTLPSCRIKSIVIDQANNFSLIDGLNVNIDWTNPSAVGFINDGISADVDTVTTNTQLTSNWQAAIDVNSGISTYLLALGSSIGDSDIVGFTQVGNVLNHTFSGLNLNYGNTYYFTVKAINGAGLTSLSTTSDGVYIKSPNAIPTASFYVQSTNICTGNTVLFNNTSTNASTCSWYFQGGTPSVTTDCNPTVLYSTAGDFEVKLVITNSYGSDSVIYSNYISVQQSPSADFTYTPNTGTLPLSVYFTNNTNNAITYLWDFGDANTSTDVNPYHVYNSAGTYNVKLVAFNGLCKDSVIVNNAIDILTNTENVFVNNNLTFYPNPTTDIITISDIKFEKIEILSMQGKKIFVVKNNKNIIDLSQVDKGIYIAKILIDNKVLFKKIVKF